MTAPRVLILAAVVPLTACSPATPPASTPTAHPTQAAQAQRQLPTASATPLAPRQSDKEAANPDPNFDYGFVVQITDTGFRPQWLVAGCCLAVTWRNLTATPASVVFDHQRVDSGPIPPGGTFVFTPPNPESIAYHSGADPGVVGVLQVQQMVES